MERVEGGRPTAGPGDGPKRASPGERHGVWDAPPYGREQVRRMTHAYQQGIRKNWRVKFVRKRWWMKRR
jgi:hypothetical protein